MATTAGATAKPTGVRDQLLAEASVLMIGILTGAMVLIALAIVSFWGSLEPSDYRLWFTTHAFHLGRVMVPLGGLSTLVAGLAWLAARRRPLTSRRWLMAALLCLLTLALTYGVFVAPINALLGSSQVLSDLEIRALLSSWKAWHWVRVVLGLLAFAAGVRACATRPATFAAANVG